MKLVSRASSRVSDARRVTMRVDALRGVDREEVPDEAVKRLVACGPDIVMSPAEDEQGREEALAAAVEAAATAGLSGRGRGELQETVGRGALCGATRRPGWSLYVRRWCRALVP